MRRFGYLAGMIVLCATFAYAESWVPVSGLLQVDSASISTDAQGFTLYKTRELDANGTVKYQHKEAVKCTTGFHSFRNMYDGQVALNAADSSDAWADWQSNAREVYDADRLVALRNYICRTKGETGIPACDEHIRLMRQCNSAVSDSAKRAQLDKLVGDMVTSIKGMGTSALTLAACQAFLDEDRKEGCYGGGAN